ncbi:hypothetical protein [Piscirickettsia salmonis]|uniref:hypothetical protein n=1 Tax=Piscirickettsia salmonis TaxID=1238 RepID=UPI000332CD40|nr:hypothetical protein [Piscirickettsia salmonis]ERL60969.1 hypothetical protein K661_02710 [Piscirickettsia salmonis LF-89 = ATCC VR-1361]
MSLKRAKPMFNTKQKLLITLLDMTKKDPLSVQTKACAYIFGLALLLAWTYVLISSGLIISLILAVIFVAGLYFQVNRYASKLINSSSTQKPRIEDIRLLVVSSKSMILFCIGALVAYVAMLFNGG